MAVSFIDIVEGIAANLSSIDGLNESAYVLAAKTLPVAEVSPLEGEYDKTFQRGIDALAFTVRVLVGAVTEEGAQRRLYRMLDPAGATSIKAAIESDKTLGGVAIDVHVTGWSEPRIFSRAGTDALGCEWRVLVWIEGTP